MVTKYIPGYGNVTAREDMFVGDGNNISIIINKDYKEIGVITPIVETHPNVSYVKVVTPYGNVSVPQDTYNKVGKDQIASDFEQLMIQRNELISSGKVKLGESTGSVSNNSLSVPKLGVSQMSRSIVASPMASVSVREDLGFTHVSGMQPQFIWGDITPQAGSPLPPSGYVSYQELEVHLNNNGDVLEYISDHRSNEISVWVCLWDNGNWLKYIEMPYFDNVNGTIEYYFNYNPVLGYIAYLYNPATGEARSDYFLDNTTSTYINFLDASSELTYVTPIQTWHDETSVGQYIAMVGSTYYLPADVFSMGTVGSRSQYVDVSGTEYSGQYTTVHKDGSNVT